MVVNVTTTWTAVEKEEIERIYTGYAIEAQKQLTTTLQKPRKKIIIIGGPTAAGKSDFALKLAKELGGEIISGDSMQVYRGMDIGTAKPSAEEQKEVPHHIIDIHDVKDPFNVVDFYYEARHICQQILAREAVPIIVGGSGFYLHALIYGPPAGPPSVLELRKSLEKEMEERGSEAMYAQLMQLDPQYANTITKNDKQKIVRALEIMRLTGKKVSKISWQGRRKPQNYDFRCWFLHRPRDILYKRIDHRCEKMLEMGLIEEVQRLEAEGIKENSSAAQAIGYKQTLDYLASPQTKADYKHFVEKFQQASRNYAKRQFTWFRKEPLFRWLDLDMHDAETALDMVIQDYRS